MTALRLALPLLLLLPIEVWYLGNLDHPWAGVLPTLAAAVFLGLVLTLVPGGGRVTVGALAVAFACCAWVVGLVLDELPALALDRADAAERPRLSRPRRTSRTP